MAHYSGMIAQHQIHQLAQFRASFLGCWDESVTAGFRPNPLDLLTCDCVTGEGEESR